MIETEGRCAEPAAGAPPRAVLLDYGGVIAEEGMRNGLAAMAREQELDPGTVLREAGQAIYGTGFVLGRGSAQAFWRALCERTGLQGEASALTQRILAGFVLRSWVIERVDAWRARGYITGILSDQTDWLDELNARDRFFDHFDHVFNSYHLGRGKRDPGLFPELAQRLGLAPGEILLVDDLESNVNRARAAGWQAFLYRDRAGFEAAMLRLLD